MHFLPLDYLLVIMEKVLEINEKFRIFVYMIPITLPNGKVAFVTLEESLDDEFMKELATRDDGYEVENPFDGFLDRMRDPKSWTVPEAEANELTDKDIEKIKKEIGKDKN